MFSSSESAKNNLGFGGGPRMGGAWRGDTREVGGRPRTNFSKTRVLGGWRGLVEGAEMITGLLEGGRRGRRRDRINSGFWEVRGGI